MKQTIRIFLLLITLSACSQNKTILEEPKVDKRIELLSIVFRLAGSSEYSQRSFPKYVENTDNFGSVMICSIPITRAGDDKNVIGEKLP